MEITPPLRFLEPILAFLVLVLLAIPGTSHGSPAWVIALSVVLVAAAALSGYLPLSTLAVSAAASLAMCAAPADQASLAPIACYVVLFSWIARDRPHPRSVTLGICIATYLPLGLAQEGFPPTPITTLMILFSTGLAVVGALTFRWLMGEMAAQRTEARRQERELRTSLARDLHDTVAQTLAHTAMRANLAAAEASVTDSTKATLEQIAQECSDSATDLRQLLSGLRNSGAAGATDLWAPRDAATLTDDVYAQADRLRDAGFQVDADVHVMSVSAARATTLSMVLREAVTNVIKHASAGSPVSLRLIEEGGVVRGTLVNQAPTCRINRHGWGIIGMRERMGLLNGSLTLEDGNGQWTVRAELPGTPPLLSTVNTAPAPTPQRPCSDHQANSASRALSSESGPASRRFSSRKR